MTSDQSVKQGAEQPTSPEVLFANAPESLALQTYEYFEGEGVYRTAQKNAFLSGEVRNPRFDYPLLEESAIVSHERALGVFLEEVNHSSSNEDVDMAYWAAAGYRLAEAFFLHEALRLNGSDEPTKQSRSAERFMQLGGELYGRAEKPIFRAAVNEIWRQIDSKDLDEVGRQIKAELEELLLRPNTSETIPTLSPLASEYYKHKIKETFVVEKSIVDQQFVRIQARTPAEKDEAEFTAEDIFEVFEGVNNTRGGGEYGIRVCRKDGTAIAFSISDKTLYVGDKHINIKNSANMFARVVHDYGVHVTRYMNGLKSGVFVSATGHYDYLDFEEGLASVFEALTRNEPEKLEARNIGHYVHIGLAQGLDGGPERDFRDVFEIAWRYRLLMGTKSGVQIKPEDVDIVKSKTYDLTIKRIFRGTPCSIPGVVYTKDLTYLRGRVKATQYLEEHAGEGETYDMLFAAKYDPTNDLHTRVVYGVRS